MTDLLTENARLRAALEQIVTIRKSASLPWTHKQAADNYLQMVDTIKGVARAALATSTPDAVQQAARVLLGASYGDMQPAFHAIDTARDADEGPEETFAAALRAIAGDRT